LTLEKVAQRAGVSTATVSRVMNKPSMVSEDTRVRVLAAAKELNYQPNRYAQSLAGGRSRTLGMIVSNIENPFFLDILHSLEERATQAGYEVMYENTDYRPARLAAAVDLMLARPLAGLAVIASEADESVIERLAQWDRPVIVSDWGDSSGRLMTVTIRYEKAMQRAVEYLYSLGHRRMAFVGHHGTLDPLRQREHAFVSTVRRFSDVQSSAATSADSPAGGRQAVHQLLGSGFRPTAVLCVNDFMAIGVLRELRDIGLRVPEDVSVTGFDNIELAEYLYPALTTVNIPRRRLGHLIFDALAPGEDRPVANRQILIEPELVLRESTARVSTALRETLPAAAHHGAMRKETA
jgi:LacI family transcriptional regulator